MKNAGAKCGLAGVFLQAASMPAAVYGHGVLAALMVSLGTSLTYLGLKSVALSGSVKPLSSKYRYLIASIITYSLVIAAVSALTYGSGSSLQVFVAVILPLTIAAQIMYSISYSPLMNLWGVNIESLCKGIKALGIITALTSGIQLIAYMISPKAFTSVYNVLWLLPLAIFAALKAVELITWVKLRSVRGEPLTPKSWLLAASATLLLIGASGVAAGLINTSYLIISSNDQVTQVIGYGQQLTGVKPVEEVVKAYVSNPLVIGLERYNSSIFNWSSRIKYLVIKPPYDELIVGGCPQVRTLVMYPVVCVGEADITDHVGISEYVYGPRISARLNMGGTGHELRLSLINSTLINWLRVTELIIKCSGRVYGNVSNPPLIVVNIGDKVDLIKLPPSGRFSISEIYWVNDTVFNVYLVVPKPLMELYVINYMIEARSMPKVVGNALIICKCLGTLPSISPLPPYPLLSSEVLGSNLVLIPYSLVIFAVGLVSMIAYAVISLRKD